MPELATESATQTATEKGGVTAKQKQVLFTLFLEQKLSVATDFDSFARVCVVFICSSSEIQIEIKLWLKKLKRCRKKLNSHWKKRKKL